MIFQFSFKTPKEESFTVVCADTLSEAENKTRFLISKHDRCAEDDVELVLTNTLKVNCYE